MLILLNQLGTLHSTTLLSVKSMEKAVVSIIYYFFILFCWSLVGWVVGFLLNVFSLFLWLQNLFMALKPKNILQWKNFVSFLPIFGIWMSCVERGERS